jgi:hypothetical protein
MTSLYPNYEKCMTKVLDGDFCLCLMNEFNQCPQKKLYLGMNLCTHPENFRFDTGSFAGRLIHSKQ